MSGGHPPDGDEAHRWRRIEVALEAALKAPAAERSAVVESLCADDPALRAEIEALLAGHAAADAFLETPAAEFAAPYLAELTESGRAPGDMVGRYRLLEEIGRGGTGSVWLAERADGQFEQRVALKLIKRGMDCDAILSLFLRERRILARLEHPHIARLLDGGASDDGLPYFVMEYVRGIPITSYCDENALEIAERLRLFESVCRAIQYAHRNLVVHCDLKPSNVFVAADGEVKLLDFGIAKVLEADRGTTPATQTLLRFATPEYASPEQIRGEPVTTQTDVYQLGLLLYELLTGRRSYTLEGKTPGEVDRIVYETEPARPSAVVESRFGRRLRGDLDGIVLTALRKEPERRYASVEALADDVRRHLAGLPVLARGDRVGYRIGKFLRRNRLAAGLIAAFVAVLVGFAAWSSYQADRFQRERDKARQLAGFMEGVFTSADPEYARGEDLTARELLDRGVGQLAATPANAAVQADFLTVMGRTYQRLGDYEQAGDLFGEALAIHRGLLDSPPREVARALTAVAENHHANGAFADAETVFREALGLLEGHDDDASRRVAAEAMAKLGRTLGRIGKAAAGLALLEQALAVARAHADPASELVAERLNDVGSAYFRLGRYDQALERLEQAVAIRRTLDAQDWRVPGSPRTATILNNTGLLHYLSGKPERAEPLFREALTMRRTLLAADHPDIAQTLTNLGMMYKDYGRAAEAVPLLEEALAIRKSALRPDHVHVAHAIHNLAIARQKTGAYAEAAALSRDALERMRGQLGDEHPEVAVVHNDLGSMLLDMGNDAGAEREYRQALAIRRKVLPDEHPHLAWSLVGLGRALVALNRPDQAEPLLREALAIRQKTLPADDPLVVKAITALNAALKCQGKEILAAVE